MTRTASFSWIEKTGNPHATVLAYRRSTSRVLKIALERVAAEFEEIHDQPDTISVHLSIDGRPVEEAEAILIEKEVERLFTLVLAPVQTNA